MKTHLLLLAALTVLASPVIAKDSLGRPSVEIPKSAAALSMTFSDTEKWDGRRIDRSMLCKDLGGDKPASPPMLITGAPENTQSLVVYFANPRSFHNHGTFRVRERKEAEGWKVPPVLSGAQRLPRGVEVFDGGSTWGKAYNAPCPTQGSWLFTVTVYALDEDDKVIGVGEKELGYAP